MVFSLFRRPRMAVLPGGIELSPPSVRAGDDIVVKYHGTLAHDANGGNGQVLMRAGYGADGTWHDVQDIAMSKAADGSWTAEIAVDSGVDQLNFCFTDDTGNWDNNSGANWALPVQPPLL